MKIKSLTLMSVFLAVGCAQDKYGASSGSSDTGGSTSAAVAALGLAGIPSSNNAPTVVCPTITDSTMLSQLASIDAQFRSVYVSASSVDKAEIVAKFKGLLVILKDKTEQERQDFLHSLPRPIPSCPVVKALVEGTYS